MSESDSDLLPSSPNIQSRRSFFGKFFPKGRKDKDFGSYDKPKPERSNEISHTSDRLISRREALRLIFGALGATLGYEVYSKNKIFFDKAGKSVREGKILEDINEVIASREKKGKATLGKESFYDSDWIKGFFESMKFYEVEVTGKRTPGFLGVLEITNNSDFLMTEKQGQDISEAFGEKGRFMTLPTPQHDQDNNYLMFAVFNINGKKFYASRNTRSEIRGGIIVDDKGIRAGVPGDFPEGSAISSFGSFDGNKPNSALIEYFYTFDSNDPEGISALKKIRTLSGKDPSNAEEHACCIVTFYAKDGKFRTFVMTSYRDFDTKNGKFNPENIRDFTIPQLIDLARDYQKREMPDFDRFIVTFADPGPNQSLVDSTPYSDRELRNKGLEPFFDRSVPPGESKVHRILGGTSLVNSTFRPARANKPAYLVVRGGREK